MLTSRVIGLERFVLRQHLGDECHHQVLLRRITHGDHKRESGKRVVGELGLPMSIDEELIACQEWALRISAGCAARES